MVHFAAALQRPHPHACWDVPPPKWMTRASLAMRAGPRWHHTAYPAGRQRRWRRGSYQSFAVLWGQARGPNGDVFGHCALAVAATIPAALRRHSCAPASNTWCCGTLCAATLARLAGSPPVSRMHSTAAVRQLSFVVLSSVRLHVPGGLGGGAKQPACMCLSALGSAGDRAGEGVRGCHQHARSLGRHISQSGDSWRAVGGA